MTQQGWGAWGWPLLLAVLGGCGSPGAPGARPGPSGRPGGGGSSGGGAAGQAMGRGGLAGGIAPGAGGSAGTATLGAGGGGSRGAAAAGGAGAGTVAITGDPNAAGFRPLRLLTGREYLNTVRDLFGVTTYVDALGETKVILPPLEAESEDPDSGFAFHFTGAVVEKDSLSLETAAEQLAQAAVGRIGAWLPCAETAAGDAAEADCLSAFFAPGGFATKIFRRPLSTEDTTGEVARLTALYHVARGAPMALDVPGAMGVVVEAMLQSPEFLYHWQVESGPPTLEGAVVKLGHYELANRLSYLLWGTMPDDQLFAAAAAGELGDQAGVEAQARRMLADDRAADAVGDFFTDWLDVDRLPFAAKDSATYPAYGDGLIAAMMQEVRLFTSTIALAGSGRFDDILTATSSFADSQLASVYGLTGAAATSAFAPVSLPQAERSGLLTTAGFLALTGAPDGSDPPRRGKAVYVRLLCGTLPTPAPPMPAVAPATPGGPTTRQRFAAADGPDCAASCHSIIDPLGFAFEHYDGIGAYRTMDDGLPVDASATVSLDGRSIGVADARELLAALVTSDQAQSCFVRQWLRYALGRAETAADLASLETAQNVFTASMRNIRELLVAVATSRTFRYRTPGTGEVLP